MLTVRCARRWRAGREAARTRRVMVAAMMLATFAGLAAMSAWAQFPGGTANPGDRRGGMGSNGRASRSAAKSDQADGNAPITLAGIVELRLTELEEDLKLTPAQQPPWVAYSTQVVKLLSDASRGSGDGTRNETSAPQQLDHISDVARNRLTAIEDIADAGKALYAVLTPAQQSIADRRLVLAVLPLAGGESLRTGSRPGSAPRRDIDNSGANPSGSAGTDSGK